MNILAQRYLGYLVSLAAVAGVEDNGALPVVQAGLVPPDLPRLAHHPVLVTPLNNCTCLYFHEIEIIGSGPILQFGGPKSPSWPPNSNSRSPSMIMVSSRPKLNCSQKYSYGFVLNAKC